MTTSTGAIRRYGSRAMRRTGSRSATAAPPGPRRRSGPGGDCRDAYGSIQGEGDVVLAHEVACSIDGLSVRMRVSIVRSTFAFSTSTQCLAVGMNQLPFAARSLTAVTEQVRRVGDVALRLERCPASCVLVNALIQSIAACPRVRWRAGIARSEPPRNAGIDLPLMTLGITNCFSCLVLRADATAEPGGPDDRGRLTLRVHVVRLGPASSAVLLACDAARKKALYARSPARACGESSRPTHLPLRNRRSRRRGRRRSSSRSTSRCPRRRPARSPSSSPGVRVSACRPA